jgi:DNA invertase Pin-like site-specific DNA recombinase
VVTPDTAFHGGRTLTDRSAALYARVSTAKQGESLETQLNRLRGVTPGAVEFVDAGVSGRDVDRPAFDRLVDAIRADHVDSVTVTKLDRLGRSARAILDFFNEADARHVRVVVADQAIDTSTPVGRMVRTVVAAMAELEADLIAERTREAMVAFKTGARKTRSGLPVGRPRVLTPQVVQRIREERAKGLPWSVVAQHTGICAGTCRKVGPSPRSEIPRVGNPPPEFPPPKGEP